MDQTVVRVPRLRSSRIDRSTFVMASLRPQDWLPTASEFGRPDDPLAIQLDAYLDALGPMPVRPSEGNFQELVTAAEAAGVLDDDDAGGDAWDALFQLTFTWMRDERDSLDELDANIARFTERFGSSPFDGQPIFINTDEAARTYWNELSTPSDFGETLDLADRVVEQFPGHPAADYARLFGMGVVTHVSAAQYDRSEAFARSMEAFEVSPDRLVGEAAVSALSGGSFMTMNGEVDSLLEDAYAAHPTYGVTIAMFGMESAFASGQYTKAAGWWRRLSDSVLTRCDCVSDSPHTTCPTRCRWLEKSEQQLVAKGVLESSTWQGSLRGLTQRCAWESDAGDIDFEMEGEWVGRWRWGPAEPPGATAECLNGTAWTGPNPPSGQSVKLVYGGRPRLVIGGGR